MASVGADKLAVRRAPPALKKNHPLVQVDLSAIAKGHGVDRVAGVLDRLNYKAYFVEIGGEVRTRGRKLDGSPWQVGIEHPEPNQRSVERVLPLSDRSLATSGNYRNYFEFEGKRYAHTLNPRTGWPVEDPIVSASVVADNCALADGIATGLMSAGFEAGLALAEKHGWSVMLMRATPSGVFEIAESTQFSQDFPPPPQTAAK
jgi:thiamine biosynthesis lipoprotein